METLNSHLGNGNIASEVRLGKISIHKTTLNAQKHNWILKATGLSENVLHFVLSEFGTFSRV